MRWEGVTEFVFVAEAKSFTKAALNLQTSTAQVSRQITALEKRLNVKLLYRTTRKVSLTEEGHVFYQHCRSVLDGLENAELAITKLQSKPQGKLKITVPVTYGEQKILPMVNDFVLLHRELEVEANLTNLQVDLVEQGYDLAIRLGHLPNSTLMARKLGSRTNYLCAAPSYLAKHGTPHSISELAQHRCLLGTKEYWQFNDNGKESNVRMAGRLRYNSGKSLVDAALKGLGIVQLPDYYVQKYLSSGALVGLLEQCRPAEEGIWAVYPQNRHLSPKVRLLVDYLAERLQQAAAG